MQSKDYLINIRLLDKIKTLMWVIIPFSATLNTNNALGKENKKYTNSVKTVNLPFH